MTDDGPIAPTLTESRFGDPGDLERPRPGLVLLFSEVKAARRVFLGEARTEVGRHPDLLVSLDDPLLSRTHARFTFDDAGIRVRDLKSHNGTFVNGARTESETALRAGDVVRCGSALLLVVEDVRVFVGWPGSADVPPLLGGPRMEQVRRRIDLLAGREIDVLIRGETGTGKDVAARLVHDRSGARGAFVPVNCAAVPEAVFEAELFGALKGAFTGAESDRPGLMQAARGGTLFLDEVGELPPGLQPKLLRAVEQREARPVGATRAERVDFRLVAATNRDLAQDVSEKRFREDLYHRLSGVVLAVPPLGERREDIVFFARRFLEREADGLLPGRGASWLTAPFVEQLAVRPWTGNVRELHRTLREALLQAATDGSDRLRVKHLPEQSSTGDAALLARVREALVRSRGNVTRAATALDLKRRQVYELLKAHGLRAEDFR